ncbi:MAG: hypothetical protein GQ570_11055 [Helicobacteraceae bacterium]|nr:hypothetical protein [Helicobacteraceae bacterium]
METKEWVMIISAIIVVVGWFINSFLNRRHEISKKRLEYRLETLHSFLPVYLSISSSLEPFKDDKELNDKIMNARVNFQLYGYRDEIILFQDFVNAIEKPDINKVTITVNKLIKLTRDRIRNELKLPSFDL